MIPAIIPAHKNNSNAPISVIATKIMAVSPDAGPETEMLELLITPTTIPPTTPEMMPDNGGAPDASAIPRHSGKATRNTTSADGKFSLIPRNKDVEFFICKFLGLTVLQNTLNKGKCFIYKYSWLYRINNWCLR